MSATVALLLIAITVLSMVLVTIVGLHYGTEMLGGEDQDNHDQDNDARGGAA